MVDTLCAGLLIEEEQSSELLVAASSSLLRRDFRPNLLLAYLRTAIHSLRSPNFRNLRRN